MELRLAALRAFVYGRRTLPMAVRFFYVDESYDAKKLWPLYAEFIDTVWMPEYAPAYLESRDPIALELLPRLLPPPDPQDQKHAVAETKFFHMKETVRKIRDKKP